MSNQNQQQNDAETRGEGENKRADLGAMGYIWSMAGKTNPKYTKSVTQGKRTFTAINATYQIMKATEIFGLMGDTWGLKNLTYDYQLFEATGMVTLKADFYYPNEKKDQVLEFEITNAIKVKYTSSKGHTIIDDDFCKKIETDTMTKALAKIGFSADIFLGKYEDQAYVNEQRVIHELETVDMSDDEIKEAKKEFFAWAKKETEAYTLIPNEAGIKAAYASHMPKVKQKCDLLGVSFNDYEVNGEQREGMGTKFQNAQRAAIQALKEKQKNKDNNQGDS